MSKYAYDKKSKSEYKGFEYELSEKQKFYLTLYQLCPSIDILHILWKQYCNNNYKIIIEYYTEISPFKEHPCGNDSIFVPVAGLVDPDMFLAYYKPRENYLRSIKMFGHPWFICQFYRNKEIIETSINYFDSLINEPQKKLINLSKVSVLNKVIVYLNNARYSLTIDQIIRYLFNLYCMYKDNRVLHAYPLAIDCNGNLCRFE